MLLRTLRLSILPAILYLLSTAHPAAAADTMVSNNDNTADALLQPLDLIRVQIFQEPDLLRDVRISQSGTIHLPLIEKVDLRGKTLRQAEQTIRDRYDRDFLVNPQVTLVVIEYAPRTVNVLGHVNTPGAIAFPQEQKLTVLDAITRAGGFNRLADRKRVKITRTFHDGRRDHIEVNVDLLISGSTGQAWTLLPGDNIYVPERLL